MNCGAKFTDYCGYDRENVRDCRGRRVRIGEGAAQKKYIFQAYRIQLMPKSRQGASIHDR